MNNATITRRLNIAGVEAKPTNDDIATIVNAYAEGFFDNDELCRLIGDDAVEAIFTKEAPVGGYTPNLNRF